MNPATQLKPFYDHVQAIYDHDHTTDLLDLFLDPTMLYSCAYFERDDMTLEEAQIAKLDLSLQKCGIKPGHRLLEIGCGWGACAYRAAEKYDIKLTGLTLSERQAEFCKRKMQGLGAKADNVEIRVQGWEEFHEPVDRIISIAAFEHFRYERYKDFFPRCHQLLPEDGRMLLHTIVRYGWDSCKARGINITHDIILFSKFVAKEIFPHGQLVDPIVIRRFAEEAGFRIEREHSLQSHYAKTLDIWAENLKRRKDEAIALRSEEVYNRYMKYLTGCAEHFRIGHIDIIQFTLCKS